MKFWENFSHPLFGGAWVEWAASSWHEDFRVDVEEGKKFFEVEFFASVSNGFWIASFKDDYIREFFDLVLSYQHTVWRSYDSEVELLLEGNAQAFV